MREVKAETRPVAIARRSGRPRVGGHGRSRLGLPLARLFRGRNDNLSIHLPTSATVMKMKRKSCVTQKITYTNEPLGKTEVVRDFLPPPSQLAFCDEGGKARLAPSCIGTASPTTVVPAQTRLPRIND